MAKRWARVMALRARNVGTFPTGPFTMVPPLAVVTYNPVVQLGRTARIPPAGEGARPSHTLTAHRCERRARAVSLWVCRAVRSACERAHGNPVTARYLLLGRRVVHRLCGFCERLPRTQVRHALLEAQLLHAMLRLSTSRERQHGRAFTHGRRHPALLHEPQSRCWLDNEPSSRRAVRMMTGSKVWRAVSD